MKSGYRALCDEARRKEASSSNAGLVAGFWTKIWKLGVPGKVKHFLWRACTNSLPTKLNLVKRKIMNKAVYHLCGQTDKDTLHALWGCETVKQVWDRDFNWVNQFEVAQGSFLDLVAKVLTKLRMREVFAATTWFVWTHKNKSRLNEKTLPLSGIRDPVSNFLHLYHPCREPPARIKMVRQCRRKPPNPGEYKVNFDGAMFNESDEAGVGVVVRDSRGLVVVAMLEKIIKPHSVECLELLAARRAVIFAEEIGLQQSHIEGDSEIVIKGLLEGGMHFSSLGHLFRDILFHVSSMRSFSFTHVVRQSNAVANALAQRARLSFSAWMKFVSSDIDGFVSADIHIMDN
nr:hypothetical protein CFP56_18200 [Quercus suber]